MSLSSLLIILILTVIEPSFYRSHQRQHSQVSGKWSPHVEVFFGSHVATQVVIAMQQFISALVEILGPSLSLLMGPFLGWRLTNPFSCLFLVKCFPGKSPTSKDFPGEKFVFVLFKGIIGANAAIHKSITSFFEDSLVQVDGFF